MKVTTQKKVKTSHARKCSQIGFPYLLHLFDLKHLFLQFVTQDSFIIQDILI